MEKITQAHGGRAVSGHWEDIDPTKYDEAHEVQGLELDAGTFISPYDVPDGVRINFEAQRVYAITLRYLTDQEEIVPTKSEVPEIQFGLGYHSKRLVSLVVDATTDFPEWETVEQVLVELTNQQKLINHFVALSVLRDLWSRLASQVEELQAG